MTDNKLKELVEQTFNKLCRPAGGHGMYAEIEHAIRAAFDMGKEYKSAIPNARTPEDLRLFRIQEILGGQAAYEA